MNKNTVGYFTSSVEYRECYAKEKVHGSNNTKMIAYVVFGYFT